MEIQNFLNVPFQTCGEKDLCHFFPLRISQEFISSGQLNLSWPWLIWFRELATFFYYSTLKVGIGCFNKKAWLVLYLESKMLFLFTNLYYILLKRKMLNCGLVPSVLWGTIFRNKAFWILKKKGKQLQTANIGSGNVVITTHHYYSRTHRFPSLKYYLKKPPLYIIFVCGKACGMRGISNLYLCNLMFLCNYQLGLKPEVLCFFNRSGFVCMCWGELLLLVTINFTSLMFGLRWHWGTSLYLLRSLLLIGTGWASASVEGGENEIDCNSRRWQH